AFLFMADRAEHQKWIRKKLEKSFVICDRYMDSTTAYQGEKLKKFLKEPISFLSNIQKSFVIIPNITFLILVPVEQCLKRIEKRKKTRFEKEKYLRGVEKNYLEIARNEKRIVKVDGTNPIEDVVRFLVEYIKDRALKV
ncbi:MAG: dTMP kinase, partial [Candidatus Thermoplasmatota archaeon]